MQEGGSGEMVCVWWDGGEGMSGGVMRGNGRCAAVGRGGARGRGWHGRSGARPGGVSGGENGKSEVRHIWTHIGRTLDAHWMHIGRTLDATLDAVFSHVSRIFRI